MNMEARGGWPNHQRDKFKGQRTMTNLVASETGIDIRRKLSLRLARRSVSIKKFRLIYSAREGMAVSESSGLSVSWVDVGI